MSLEQPKLILKNQMIVMLVLVLFLIMAFYLDQQKLFSLTQKSRLEKSPLQKTKLMRLAKMQAPVSVSFIRDKEKRDGSLKLIALVQNQSSDYADIKLSLHKSDTTEVLMDEKDSLLRGLHPGKSKTLELILKDFTKTENSTITLSATLLKNNKALGSASAYYLTRPDLTEEGKIKTREKQKLSQAKKRKRGEGKFKPLLANSLDNEETNDDLFSERRRRAKQ